MKKFRTRPLIVLIAAVLALPVAAAYAQTYPSKSINIVVFSSAGGGTDLVNRQLGIVMEKILGQKIIVSNMPGGLGGTAAEYIYGQAHDGYSLLGCSETSATFQVNGASKHGSKDWRFFIASGSPGVIAVKADSPLKTIDDLLKAAKDKPRQVKIGNSGKGKLWHIKAMVIEKNANVKFLHMPYNGSNPAILSTLSGETDAVSAALGEVSEQVRAGKMRILVLTEDKRVDHPTFKQVPALSELYPGVRRYFPLQQWLGFAVPKDTPAPVVRTLTEAFRKAMQDPSMSKFNEENFLSPISLDGDEAMTFAQRLESNLSWISKELGIIKNDPASFGIPKPLWM